MSRIEPLAVALFPAAAPAGRQGSVQDDTKPFTDWLPAGETAAARAASRRNETQAETADPSRDTSPTTDTPPETGSLTTSLQAPPPQTATQTGTAEHDTAEPKHDPSPADAIAAAPTTGDNTGMPSDAETVVGSAQTTAIPVPVPSTPAVPLTPDFPVSSAVALALTAAAPVPDSSTLSLPLPGQTTVPAQLLAPTPAAAHPLTALPAPDTATGTAMLSTGQTIAEPVPLSADMPSGRHLTHPTTAAPALAQATPQPLQDHDDKAAALPVSGPATADPLPADAATQDTTENPAAALLAALPTAARRKASPDDDLSRPADAETAATTADTANSTPAPAMPVTLPAVAASLAPPVAVPLSLTLPTVATPVTAAGDPAAAPAASRPGTDNSRAPARMPGDSGDAPAASAPPTPQTPNSPAQASPLQTPQQPTFDHVLNQHQAPQTSIQAQNIPASGAATPSALPGSSLPSHTFITPVTEQVSLQMRKAIDDGQQQIRIQMKPAALGQVEVRLEVGHDGHVKAVVAAEKHETFDWLQRDARTLERILQDSGLKTDSGSLSFQYRGGEGGQQRGFGEQPWQQGRERPPAPSLSATLNITTEAAPLRTLPAGRLDLNV
jgi:flagellar hook-length control protein FliK